MGLRLPDEIDQVSHDRSSYKTPFFPLGFIPFQEHSLGNGDTFGLYWPIGKEKNEPLVAEIFHDDGSLVPAFSSLRKFLAFTSNFDESEYPGLPPFDEDRAAPLTYLEEARKLLREQNVEPAIELLEHVTSVLPEYTEALALLTTQYLRSGRHNDACQTAIRTVISPPSFGSGQNISNIWRWLSQQNRCPTSLCDDPIWQERSRLESAPIGGVKKNNIYHVLSDAINTYIEKKEFVSALTLMQTYAEFMSAETVSFQERYSFNGQAYRSEQLLLSDRLQYGPRFLP